MIWLLLYFIFATVFLINLSVCAKTLEYVRQAVSVRERPKLVEKISYIKSLQKYCILWPYIIYKLSNSK
jgi:hypothetical protein